MSQDKEPVYSLTFGEHTLTYDMDKLTKGIRNSLEKSMIELRKKQSPYYKFPMNPEETEETWKKRLAEEAPKEFLRKKGESSEAHLNRLYDIAEGQSFVNDVFNAVTMAFDKKVYTNAEIDAGHPKKINQFLYEVLTYCNIAAADFAPKELGKQ